MEKKGAHFLRLAGLILGATLAISLLVLLIGYIYQWDKSVQFSNAFFAAGAVTIILGIFSITGKFAKHVVIEVAERYGVVILLLSTGLLLISIAIAIGRLFIIK